MFPPRPMQVEGTEALLRHPRFALFDKVGAGKTKQIIDAAQVLYEAGEVDTMLVVSPASVRGVWSNPDPVLGEVAKHGWRDVPNLITEFSAKRRRLPARAEVGTSLQWIVTNYEFIRYGCAKKRVKGSGNRKVFVPGDPAAALAEYLPGRKIWMICDEAWALGGYKALQTITCQWFAAKVPRVTLLDGSPVSSSPLALYPKMAMLDPKILGVQDFFHFRARYAIMAPIKEDSKVQAIVGWHDLDDLQRRTAPYILCREAPPTEVSETHIEVALTDSTWRVYKQMRDQMVAWLSSGEATIAKQAIVRGLRLSQITAGFAGGVERVVDPDLIDVSEQLQEVPEDLCPYVATPDVDFTHEGDLTTSANPVREVGTEALDAVLDYLENWFETTDPPFKVVLWARFRPEQNRYAAALRVRFPAFQVAQIIGGQKPEDRQAALQLLAPGGDPRPAIVVANPQAGGSGLNFGAANLEIFATNDFNLRVREQARGRVEPRSKRHVTLVDVLVTGPQGQKTISHTTVSALRRKDDLAKWTSSAWKKALSEE